MRIVAGIYGGRVLSAPRGNQTRPTSDKVREAVFNILGEPPVRVLDLFAGSGLLGLEALSRGAQSAHFVDSSKMACRQIQRNIDSLAVNNAARVLCFPVEKALPRLDSTFGWLFLDPPYAKGLVEKTLLSLSQTQPSLVEAGGTIVAEHETKLAMPTSIGQFDRVDRRKYGDTSVSFFNPRSEHISLQ